MTTVSPLPSLSRLQAWVKMAVLQAICLLLQGYDALSTAAMDMLREAGVDRALSTDGLPSPSFPGTYFHPPGHIWDWNKDELVTDPGEAESTGPAGKQILSSELLHVIMSFPAAIHLYERGNFVKKIWAALELSYCHAVLLDWQVFGFAHPACQKYVDLSSCTACE